MRLSKPRALQPDKYERFECAVCMKSRLPMLGRCRKNTDESAGASADTGSGVIAGTGEADAPPAELEPDVVECSGCGVRVHRGCYGVPEDIGRPGTGAWEDSSHLLPLKRFVKFALYCLFVSSCVSEKDCFPASNITF